MEYKHYSTELKETILTRYLNGGTSLRALAAEYDISFSTISSWLRRSREVAECDTGHALVEVTDLIAKADSQPAEKSERGTVSMRINGFDIEIDAGRLTMFLEALKNVGRQ